MKPAGSALVKDESGGWFLFTRPLREHTALNRSEVRSLVKRIGEAASGGRHCVGYISYEAAPAFDRPLKAKKASAPLAWFREYSERKHIEKLPDTRSAFSLRLRRAGMSRASYCRKISEIKKLLRAGATYQVNFTFPLFLDFKGDAFALFCSLHANQQSKHSVYIASADRTICSVSPELFFAKEGRKIVSRPMKGTAARRPDSGSDEIELDRLKHSAKNAAENVMIVDMIRNDLGRISYPGSVQVASLFDIERYPTVYQATSTVVGKTDADLLGVFDALFPCASVTGAPKVETMKIIKKLERYPRGVYTGAVGYVSRDKVSFNVGIRTLEINKDGSAVYGTGSGIVWESDAASEYDECLAKAQVLFTQRKGIRLLETMAWRQGRGYLLAREHIDRMARSASYFGFPCKRGELRSEMAALARGLKGLVRVRMLLAEDGGIEFEAAPMGKPSRPWRVAVARHRVRSHDCFLYHKTTSRAAYDAALSERPDMDDMLLLNERGELTESCKANLVIVLRDTHYTPPVSSGLLAGTMRGRLIDHGNIKERVLRMHDLRKADDVYLINSVRGRIPIVLEDTL